MIIEHGMMWPTMPLTVFRTDKRDAEQLTTIRI